MAANYHDQPQYHHPQYQFQERRDSISTQFPQSSGSYHTYGSSHKRRPTLSSDSDRSTRGYPAPSSSGSQRSVFSRLSGRTKFRDRRPYRERNSVFGRRRRSRSPSHQRRTPPIIIQQNAQNPHPVEHGGMGDRLARLEEMLTGASLEVMSGKSPFSRELEAS